MKPHIRMTLKTKHRLCWIMGNMRWRKAWFYAIFRSMLLMGYPVKVRRGAVDVEVVNIDEDVIEVLEARLTPIGIMVTRRCL